MTERRQDTGRTTGPEGAGALSPAALRALAEDFATRGGDRARSLLGRARGDGGAEDLGVHSKSTVTDPVTLVDTGVEQFLRDEVAVRRPGDTVLGEEAGDDAGGPAAPGGVRWVVDPVDGTVNLLYGLPATAVSVAAEVDGRVVAGAVHGIVTGETWSACLGGGAHLTRPDGSRVALRATDCTDPALALVGTGFSYSADVRAEQGRALAHLLPRVRDIRRSGSAALDLCMVGAGRLDAYFERCLKPWDHAAGALVAAEAGAVVTVSDDDAVPTVAAAPGLARAFREELLRAGVALG